MPNAVMGTYYTQVSCRQGQARVSSFHSVNKGCDNDWWIAEVRGRIAHHGGNGHLGAGLWLVSSSTKDHDAWYSHGVYGFPSQSLHMDLSYFV